MPELPHKYKVKISLEELRELKDAIEQYGIHYSKPVITERDELELYRLSDLRLLLHKWIKPKISSLEFSGRKTGTYDIPLSHVMSLRHILLKMHISKSLQNILWQIDCIKVTALPIYNNNETGTQILLQSR